MESLSTRKKKKSLTRELVEWAIAFGIAILFAIVIREFLFAPVLVDGQSMETTLHNENRVIVNKISYKFSKPERFDIVVFHAPEGKDFIKRVIGLPGDRVKFENDTLYINGEAVDEPYLDEKKAQLGEGEILTRDEAEIVVPEGEYFLVGDNRRYSRDSRSIGTIPFDEIVGSTSLVFWPMKELRFVK